MNKMKAPAVEIKTFEDVKQTYGKQVKTREYDAQRNHLARSEVASKVSHITHGAVATQAVISVVKYPNGRKVLVDGYHRMLYWMRNSCPFDTLIVLVYEVKTNADAEAIFKSIDSRKSAKGNADFFASALRSAGFVEPTSNAYRLGHNATSFFRREGVIGDPKKPIAELAKVAKANLREHETMDMVYHDIEALGRGRVKEVLHPGVALAMFRTLQTQTADKMTSTAETFVEALIGKCGLPKQVKLKAAKQVYQLLCEDFAQEEIVLRSMVSSKEAWYDACAAYLQPKLEAIVKAKAAARQRTAKAASKKAA
jgi:hypothetical protein